MVTRRGFTIVEVVVALVLFTVALLGLAAVGAVAATAMTRALLSERAASHAGALLDSLVFAAEPVGGMTVREGTELRWSVLASGIEVRARAPNDTAELILRSSPVPLLPRRAP